VDAIQDSEAAMIAAQNYDRGALNLWQFPGEDVDLIMT
jgi:hypothetical protein